MSAGTSFFIKRQGYTSDRKLLGYKGGRKLLGYIGDKRFQPRKGQKWNLANPTLEMASKKPCCISLGPSIYKQQKCIDLGFF